MDTCRFHRSLARVEEHLEGLRRSLGSGNTDWISKRAREGIESARAELAKMRAEIWWPDDKLPF
jgi:hypothetical protein